MCQSPGMLANGQQVACRKCKLCLKNRIKDWAGRNIAESLESTASFACDLTYGPELDENRMPIPGRTDHIRAAVLTYSDVQNFLKYLRTHLGYECSYFITGEMGSLKGRAHWHIILHFQGRVPTHEVEINFSDRHKNEYGKTYVHEVCKAWPHGFMYWKRAAYEDVYYNCKYIQKDDGDDKSQRKPGMSKKPPLGARYFAKLAEQYVRQGIAPQDLLYRLPGIKKKKTGEPVEFLLQGRSAEMYLEHFVRVWEEQRPNQAMPKSDLVENFIQYGKVVKNEWAMLVREEFPKGESREPIPQGDALRAAAEGARKEREETLRARGWEAFFEQQEQWVGEADGEERQKRQEQVEWERWWQTKLHCEQKHRKGLKFILGQGWIKGYGRAEPCSCGHCPISQDETGNGAIAGEFPYGRNHPKPGAGSASAASRLGKVGRWNALYAPERQAGTGEGEKD